MEELANVQAHSHRARLRPSTSVARRASTDVDAIGVNAQAFSHVFHIDVDARLRPSTSVDARLCASTDIDALGVNLQACVRANGGNFEHLL